MSKADVELAIRARDEASDALKAVKKTVKELTGEQKDLVAAAAGASKALTDQTQALGAVNKELIKSQGKLAGLEEELRREATTAEQLGAAFTSMAAALTVATREFDDASAPAQKLSAELKALVDRSKLLQAENRNLAISSGDIKKAIDEAKLAVKPFSDAVKAAKEELRLAAAAFKASNTELSKSATEVKNADAAYAKLGVRAGELGDRLGKSQAKLASLNAELAKAGAKRGSDGAFSTKQDEAAYDSLAKKVATAAASVAGIEGKLTAVNVKFGQAGQRVRDAAAQYAQAEVNVTKAQAAFSKQQVNLATSKARAEEVSAGIAKLNEQLAENSRRSRDNSTEVAKLVGERQALNAKLAEATAVQRQANAALKEAETNTKASGAALDKQQAKVAALGVKTAAARGETAGLASKQQELGAAVEKSTAKLGGYTAALGKVEAEQGKVNKGLSLFNDTGRTTLSTAQRMKGQILSLVAAYGGLFGAINLVQRGLALQEKETGTKSRLNVVFDGDMGKTAQEMKLLRSEAERLGMVYTDLAEQYSKVAVAATSSGATIEQTRTVFFRLAEASKAVGLSSEQNERIFTAINQIFSKGKISAEELRQQLGDALPGATRILADSMGKTTAEIDKMMAAGQITSQELISFAVEASEKFGKGLAGNIDSVNSNINRTKNLLDDLQRGFNQGFFVGFGEALSTISKELGGNQGAAELAKSFGKAMGQIVVATVQFVKLAAQLAPLIVGFGAAWAAAKLADTVRSLGDANNALALMTRALKLSWVELATFKTNLLAAEAGAGRTAVVFKALGASLNLLAGVLGAGAIGYQLGQIWYQFDSGKKFGLELVFVLKDLEATIENIGGKFKLVKMLMGGEISLKAFNQAVDALDKKANAAVAGVRKTIDEMQADIDKGFGKETVAGFDSTAFLKEQEKIALAQAEQLKGVQTAAEAAEKAAKAKEKADKKAAQALEVLLSKQKEFDSLLSTSRDRVEDLGRAFEAFDDQRRSALTDGSEATLESRLKEADLKVNAFKRQSEAIASDVQKQIDKLQALMKAPEATPEQKAVAGGQIIDLSVIQSSLDSTRDADAALLRDRLTNLATFEDAQQMAALMEQRRSIQLTENSRRAQAEKLTELQLTELNNQIIAETAYGLEYAYLKAAAYAREIGNPALAEQLTAQAAAVRDGIVPAMTMWESLSKSVFGTLLNGITSFVESSLDGFAQAAAGMQSWGDALKNVGDQFRQFAIGVLKQIAQMIIQYMILKAISGMGGGLGAFAAQQLGAPVKHGGGLINGMGGVRRSVSPTWFANAERFHTGGFPGLKRDEVPAILQTGEEVLSRNNPRNALNGGGGSSAQNIKIVNTIDSGSVLEQGINTAAGEKAIMNFMRANRAGLKQVLA